MDYKNRQMAILKDGMMFNRLPMVTNDPNKLEEQAREYMTSRSFDFVSGGAGEKSTMAANRLAFRQWKVRRMLKCLCTGHIDSHVPAF